MTREQMVGLEPMPDGTVVAMVDPFKKTVYFQRETDWGPEPCSPPEGYTPPNGYRLVDHPKAGVA